MRAAFYTRQGPAAEVLTLGERPTPAPGPGEVLVRLRSSGANPSDWKARAGRGAAMWAPAIVPHSDGAGVIEATGPGLSHRIGERVWLWNGQWRRAQGTAAEYIALPAEQAVGLPDNVSYAEGACLGIPALTAFHAVRLARLAPGMSVLVQGGAGAVGHYAVQIAKRAGARVIATVSGPAKADHARAAGADEVIDYRTEDVAERIQRVAPGGVDVVLEVDLAANAATYPHLLQEHGRVVIYGTSTDEAGLPARWLIRNAISLHPFLVYDIPPGERADHIATLQGLLKLAALKHTVADVLPLQRIAQAHELGEGGSLIGNIVLSIGA
jgi:NADPH2:quinone reductase